MKTSIASFVKRHPAAFFLATAVGLGWFITFLSAQLPTSSVLLPLVAIPVSYVPAVVAWIILRVAGSTDERRAFRRRLTTVRVGWRWYAFAIVLPRRPHRGRGARLARRRHDPVQPGAARDPPALPPHELR